MTRHVRQSIKAINDFQDEYEFSLLQYNTTGLIENSTCGRTLYRDTFTLHTPHFTREKNGYYWCQIVVNGTLLQPSPYAWFYANYSNSPCERYNYFQKAEAQCANTSYPTILPPVMTTRSTTPIVAITGIIMTANNSVLTATTVMELTEPNMEPILYAVGVLSVFVLSLGIFAILLLMMLIRKRQKQRISKQRKGECIPLCIAIYAKC